jgi:hypothetical protein
MITKKTFFLWTRMRKEQKYFKCKCIIFLGSFNSFFLSLTMMWFKQKLHQGTLQLPQR